MPFPKIICLHECGGLILSRIKLFCSEQPLRALRLPRSTNSLPRFPGFNMIGDSATNRREFIRTISMAGAAAGLGSHGVLAEQPTNPSSVRNQALIAITLDLEMARNFPHWDDTQWDYEKGNLNADAKNYALEAARRVKAHGGVI